MKDTAGCYVSTLYLLSLVLAQLLITPTFATKKTYVVYMGAHRHGTKVTPTDYDRATHAHYEFLGSFLGSSDMAKDAIFYSYTKHINGFAATLDREVASELSQHPKVVSVFLNRRNKLHTTRSWDFLGMENNGKIEANSLWAKARFGEDTIIGNLDTGVWPESKALGMKIWDLFHLSGEEFAKMISIPPFVATGMASHGNQVTCGTRKLIGARYFKKGYEEELGPLNSTFNSPRDTDGHGTHTLSIAGGSFVAGANVFGLGNGTAKEDLQRPEWLLIGFVGLMGIDDSFCMEADLLAAFDEAIHDGVNVLSVSIGGYPIPYDSSAISIGSFHAVKNGIAVVCSAGNSGPNAGTILNVAPWQFTVGASTMDRRFPSNLVLGNNMQFKGESLSDTSLVPKRKFFPIISSRNAKAANATPGDAELCKAGALDPNIVKGKVLVCLRGVTGRIVKGEQAALAGAVGMVLANNQDSGNEIIADAHVLPATHINYQDGLALFSYINSTMSPVARITKPTTELGTKPAPIVAAFSSQGPNTLTPEILKPDITAPGVSVIAAFSEAIGPSELRSDKRRVMYNSVSGTSMSCPHVAGVVALLKTLHPNWSPAAIKSAIMTTASTWDNTWNAITNESSLQATPFSYGAGQVQPNRAMDPGLVYDLSTNDYLDLLCALDYNQTQIELFSDNLYTCPNKPISLISFNYPTITVPNLNGTTTISRKVKNVGTSSSIYNAFVHYPPGISVQIKPKMLKFQSVGEEKIFKVVIQANNQRSKKGYVFGQLTWYDGKHSVTSQIVVKQI